MSKPSVTIPTKYRDNDITVMPHSHNGISHVDTGGAILYGRPEIREVPSGYEFNLWGKNHGGDKHLTVSECLPENADIRELTEKLEAVKNHED